MTESAPIQIPVGAPSCANCRFHSRQTREEPLYFENNSEQMRTTDVEVFVCLSRKSPHFEKAVKVPIHCEGYQLAVPKGLSDELKAKMDAAMKRLQAR